MRVFSLQLQSAFYLFNIQGLFHSVEILYDAPPVVQLCCVRELVEVIRNPIRVAGNNVLDKEIAKIRIEPERITSLQDMPVF